MVIKIIKLPCIGNISWLTEIRKITFTICVNGFLKNQNLYFSLLLGTTMRILNHSYHSLTCHNQSGNGSVIYSMETFGNGDCPTMLTGNVLITSNTKH